MSDSSKTLSSKPFCVVHALSRNVLKASNEQAETIRARRVDRCDIHAEKSLHHVSIERTIARNQAQHFEKNDMRFKFARAATDSVQKSDNVSRDDSEKIAQCDRC